MDANHAIEDQSFPNPPVSPPEMVETAADAPLHTNGVTAEEEVKESEAETKTEEEQSDEQESKSSDDNDSDYTVSVVTEGEEISDVGSDHTVLAVREEDQGSDFGSDHTVLAVREAEYSSEEEYSDYSDDYPDYCENRHPFERRYTCRPISGNSREHLEQGNLFIMPESALGELYRARPEYPLLFEIRNESNQRVSHCGVAEFTAEEGSVMVPGWMMENLKAEAGELLFLKSVSLQKGTFAKLQPHSVAFLAIRDVKTTLEQTLSAKFLCLTTGDTIAIEVGSRKFYIDIVETKPDGAICIVDTDCAVEFAVPLDYKEPAPAPAPEQVIRGVDGRPGFIPFTGVARRLNATAGQSVGAESGKEEAKPVVTAGETSSSRENEPKKQFQPFTGKKYTLAD